MRLLKRSTEKDADSDDKENDKYNNNSNSNNDKSVIFLNPGSCDMHAKKYDFDKQKQQHHFVEKQLLGDGEVIF